MYIAIDCFDAVASVQVEGIFRNVGETDVPDVKIEVTPADCIRQHWNLRNLELGRTYGLLGYWAEKGGLKPGEEMGWGCVVSTSCLKFVVTPL